MATVKLWKTSLLALFVVLSVAGAAGLYIYYQRTREYIPPKPVVVEKEAYGIKLTGLKVIHGTVGSNQNLGTLISDHAGNETVDRMAKASADIFDLRKIKAGNTYARILSDDSAARLLYFVYEINPIDFVVFDLSDTLRVYRESKKVDRKVKTDSGTITSSLWNCFVERGLDIQLALSLSDVYAWTIDFYGLQKGDYFKVIYEEVYVDGKMIGIDRILGSRFTHSGKEFRAYHFEQNGKPAYFDENGQSLERSFLKAPLKFSRISSRFTRARMHPILRIARTHFGVDYAAPRGTPVVALGDGIVKEAGFHGGYGRQITIRHNSTFMTSYAHLSGYAKGIRAGMHVSQGQVIGYVGSSGLSTGPHLDFRVYKNGTPTDPLKLESPPARPVDPAEMTKFRQTVASVNARLG